nr:NADH dehydrogenase subunit 3 [Microrhagus sp. ZM-2022]
MIYMIIFMGSLMFTISNMLMLLAFSMSKKMYISREKMSPFECGFNPQNNARLPFSMQFFMVAIIFLIFDIEITLILPFILNMIYMKLSQLLILFNMFMFILLVGLYHEWNQGSLNWKF